MAALSRFLSGSGDKGYSYFQCLKKNNRFVWTSECEEAFIKLKKYLVSPPILGKPILGTPIRLYLRLQIRQSTRSFFNIRIRSKSQFTM